MLLRGLLVKAVFNVWNRAKIPKTNHSVEISLAGDRQTRTRALRRVGPVAVGNTGSNAPRAGLQGRHHFWR